MAKGKAQDINGMAIEHLLYAPEYVKNIAKDFTLKAEKRIIAI